ncbi:MAG: oligosaccharide flippase family protein [Vicinamibacterales bacterium]
MPDDDRPAMSMRQPRLAGWHIAGNIGAWALPLLATIVAMPFLWRLLGRDGYGLYVLAAGYAALAGSLGPLRGAAQRVASRASSAAGVRAASGGAYLAAIGTGAVALVAALVAAPAFLRVAGLDPDTSPSMLLAVRLAAAAAPAMHVTAAGRGVLIGLERYGRYGAHVAVTSGVTTLGTVLLAARGGQAPELMAWLAAASLLSAAGAVALAQTAGVGLPVFSRSDGRAIVRFGATVVATDAIGSLYVLAERTILTRAMGVGIVAEYTIPLSVASALQHALGAGAVVLLPRAGAAWARADSVALRSMYVRAVKVMVLVAVGGSIAIAGAAETLVGWWIDPGFARQTAAVVVVLLAAFAVNAAATPLWCLSEGAARPARNTALSAGIALVGAGAAVALAPGFGPLGVAWARGLAMVAVPVFIASGERRLLGGGQRELWRAIARHVVPAALVLGAAVALARHLLSGVPLIGAAGLLLAVFAGWLWRSSYFDAADRNAIGRLVRARV